jgi:Tat protein secretion system quality control protein TatD with DNase activity
MKWIMKLDMIILRVDRLYATVGCHPTRTFEWHTSISSQEKDAAVDEVWTQLCCLVEKGLSTGKLVAIGELGLGKILSMNVHPCPTCYLFRL